MRYLIFESEQSATDRLEIINNFCIENVWHDEVTNKYSDLYYCAVNSCWGIPIIEGYEFLFNESELNIAYESNDFEVLE